MKFGMVMKGKSRFRRKSNKEAENGDLFVHWDWGFKVLGLSYCIWSLFW